MENEEKYSIKVTKINDKWHARLSFLDSVIDEMACNVRQDIGYICQEMMRWADKLGGDAYTNATRHRRGAKEENYIENSKPVGTIWYATELEILKLDAKKNKQKP
jgi:hypothetical protein